MMGAGPAQKMIKGLRQPYRLVVAANPLIIFIVKPSWARLHCRAAQLPNSRGDQRAAEQNRDLL
jgi:hypothetical protein